MRVLIELLSKPSFLGDWSRRGAFNLADWLADRLGGGGAGSVAARARVAAWR